MTWTVVELAGRRTGDRKPPYDWKHGWIPVSPAARAIVAERQRKAAARARKAKAAGAKKKPASKYANIKTPEDLSSEDFLRLPNHLKFPMQRYMDEWPGKARDWLEAGRDARVPSSPAPAAPAPPVKKVVAKPRTRSKAKAKGATSMSSLQQQALDNPGSVNRDQFTAEWESATKVEGELTSDEKQAVHLWQNGSVVLGGDPDFDYDEGGDWEEDSYDGGASESKEIGVYQLLNDLQRGTGLYDTSTIDEMDLADIDSAAQGLRSALARSRTTRDVTLFRGVAQLGDVKVGDTITDSGWQATAYDPKIAQDFMNGGIVGAPVTDQSRMLVIHVPKGKNVLAVRERPEFEAITGMKHEMVLGPNSPLVVTKIEGNRVHVEYR